MQHLILWADVLSITLVLVLDLVLRNLIRRLRDAWRHGLDVWLAKKQKNSRLSRNLWVLTAGACIPSTWREVPCMTPEQRHRQKRTQEGTIRGEPGSILGQAGTREDTASELPKNVMQAPCTFGTNAALPRRRPCDALEQSACWPVGRLGQFLCWQLGLGRPFADSPHEHGLLC